MKPAQVKTHIRQWLKEHDNGQGKEGRKQLVTDCFTALFLNDNFNDAFTAYYLPIVINQIADGMVATTKPEKFQHRVADRLMTTDQLRAEIANEDTPWSRWMHADATGNVTTLLEMTKPQLLRAVDEKKRQGDVAYKDAAFFKAIADTLDGLQAVGDVWKAHDLTALYDRISLRIKADVTLAPMLTQGAAD